MGRPTKKERIRLRAEMEKLVKQGMSLSEIARQRGSSSQAVHAYLTRHGMRTVEMERRSEINIDNDTVSGDNDPAEKESSP